MTQFSDLVGKTLVEIVNNSDELIFKTSSGEVYKMYHWQDCCESVMIEDIVGDLDDLLNSPIVRAEDRSSDVKNSAYGDIEEWTFYELATNKGSVTIRWYGTSNGYYSTSVDFEKVQ